MQNKKGQNFDVFYLGFGRKEIDLCFSNVIVSKHMKGVFDSAELS